MEKKFYSAPSQTEIVAFADRHLQPYRLRHGEIIAQKCPFCNGGDGGDDETFYVSCQTGQYYCHRGKCGARGGWVSLLRHFGEAANINSIAKQYKPLKINIEERTQTINDYFKERCISEQTLDAFQIGSDQQGNIVFPFYVEGELIYVKYRQPTFLAVKRKEWAQAGAQPMLFGMDLCRANEPLIITEGQADTLALYEAGARNVVSVPSGCENFDWVDPCWGWLEQFDKIILFGDNDPPGRKMIKTLTSRLGEDRCWIIEDYPENCKDANDILMQHGAEVLIQTLNSAKETPIDGMIDLADVQDIDPTTVPRIKTFIPSLDESINGLEMGGLTVFTGKQHCPTEWRRSEANVVNQHMLGVAYCG